ncbi:hypothetical protein BHE74_00020045, partial [Ensete ventricosum]
ITEGPQPTLLLPFSSSTVAANLGCHPPLGDFTTASLTSLPLKKLKRDSRTNLRQPSPLHDIKRSD